MLSRCGCPWSIKRKLTYSNDFNNYRKGKCVKHSSVVPEFSNSTARRISQDCTVCAARTGHTHTH